MDRAVLRIIDANFNRAREGLRVVEEFCRFSLNSDRLTGRAKQIRHGLSRAVGAFDAGRLVSARDTAGDVGVCNIVEGQLGRGELRDCVTAACKRVTEALRVLAEMAQVQDAGLAGALEELRFGVYALEQDIVLFSDAAAKFGRVGLYVIISSDLPGEVISLAQKCTAAGADCVQLRAKAMPDDRLFAVAVELTEICKEAGVLSIVNDRADIAVAAGADGVHLGQNDLPVAQVRKLQLSPMIVGKSTHSLSQLRTACDELPTYVALGPVFATPTKPGVKPVGLRYVERAAKHLAGTGIGSVGVGGVALENVEDVLRAGAGAIAVCSAVTNAADPAGVCRALKDRIAEFKGESGP
jgi:thiamine-phosphate pyrophosphorylase